MTPDIWIAKPKQPEPNRYVPEKPAERVSIDGDITTNRSLFNPKKPYTSDIEVWVEDEAEAAKLKPFIGGTIARIKGDEKGAYNGSKERDLGSSRIVDTLTAVNVNRLA